MMETVNFMLCSGRTAIKHGNENQGLKNSLYTITDHPSITSAKSMQIEMRNKSEKQEKINFNRLYSALKGMQNNKQLN